MLSENIRQLTLGLCSFLLVADFCVLGKRNMTEYSHKTEVLSLKKLIHNGLTMDDRGSKNSFFPPESLLLYSLFKSSARKDLNFSTCTLV